MERPLFEVRQGAYVFNNKNELLLMQNTNGTWGILGGHLEYDESAEQGLRREIIEEASIEVRNITLLKTIARDKGYIVLYAAQYASGTLRLSDEHLDGKWVPIEDLEQFDLTYPGMIEDVKECSNFFKQE